MESSVITSRVSRTIPSHNQDMEFSNQDMEFSNKMTSVKLERSINEYEHETNHAQKRKVGKDENSQIVNISPKSRKVEAENGFEIESPNMASMLNKSFQSSPLDRKSKAKNSRWIITCDRCSFETHKMDEFQSHIHDLHSDLNDFKCSQCPFSTTSSTFLNTHRRVHENGDNIETNEHQILKAEHIKDSTSRLQSINVPINCPQPSLAIEKLENLTITAEGESQCPYCQYSNISTESVHDHMNVSHERRRWYGCPFCPLNSSCKRTVIHHLKKKHNLLTSDVFLDAIQLSIQNYSGNKHMTQNEHHWAVNVGERDQSMHTNDANAQKTPYEIKMESEIVAPENRVEEKFMPPANDNFLKRDTNTTTVDANDKVQKQEDCKYKCPDCDVLSSSKHNIKTHLQTIHQKTSEDILEKILSQPSVETDSTTRRNSTINIDDVMENGVYHLKKLCIDSLVGLIEELDESCYSDGEKRYKCLICQMISKYKRHVLTHIKNVHGKSKKFFCQICEFLDPSPNQLIRHYEDMHIVEHTVEDVIEGMQLPKEKSGKTYIMPTRLTFEVAIEENISVETRITANDKNTYQCTYCSFANPFEHSIILHINAFHTMTKWYKCHICDEALLYAHLLVSHLKKIHNISTTADEATKMVVTDKDEIKKLRGTRLKDVEVTTKRELRGSGFARVSYAVDLEEEDRNVPAHRTPVRDEDRWDVKPQIRKLYEEMEKAKLPIDCFEDPEGQSDPKTGEKITWYKCPVCPKTMRDEINVHRHINFLHAMNKWYKCDQCGVAKLDSFMLRSHFSDEHDLARTIKSIEEELCISNEKELARLKSAKIKSRIDKFIKISKEKEQKRFKPAGEQRVESGGGRSSYKCSFCDTIIKDKYNLNRHINALHTMNKWYKCNKCGETTLYRNNHIHHMRRVHDIDASTAQVDKTMIVTDEEEIMQLREEKIKTISNATVLYKCSSCDITELDPHNLVVHLKKEHGKTKTVYQVQRGMNIIQRNGLTDQQKSGDFTCSTIVITSSKRGSNTRSATTKKRKTRNSSSSSSESSKSSGSSGSSSSSEESSDENEEDIKSVSSTLSNDTFKGDLAKNVRSPSINSENKELSELACSYCYKEFASKEVCADHVNSQHEKEYCYKCSECDFVGFWARGMKLHMYNRHNIFVEQDEVGERYKCKDKNLIENVGKKERKGAIIRPSPSRPSRSSRPTKTANRRSSNTESKKTLDHQKLVPLPKDKQKDISTKVSEDGINIYICPHCSVESSVFRNIRDHVNSKHEFGSWYKCSECDFISFWTSSIRDHLKEKHNTHVNSFREIDYQYLIRGEKGALQENQDSITIDWVGLWGEEMNGSSDRKSNTAEVTTDGESPHSLRKSKKAVSYNEDDNELDSMLEQSKIKLLSAWNRALPSTAHQPNSTSNSNPTSPRKERKERKDLLCPYCEKDLLNKENYEGHINAKHEKKFCYKCPVSVCNYVSLWRKGFREHLQHSHKIEYKNNEEIDNKCKNYERELIERVRFKRTSDDISQERAETDKLKSDEIGNENEKDVSIKDGYISETLSKESPTNKQPTKTEKNQEQYFKKSTEMGCQPSVYLQQLPCEKCKDIFKEEQTWASHMEQKHGIPQILLMCPECEYGSQHKSNFTNHLVKKHAYNLSTPMEINMHQVTMFEKAPFVKDEKGQLRTRINGNGEYGCPRCDYTYETINLLETHCKEGHGPNTWYLCPCCPYENRFLNMLRKHLFKDHENEAKLWGNNLEGRKVDKNRFKFNSHCSPPGHTANSQLGISNSKNSLKSRGMANEKLPAAARSTMHKSDDDDCILIDDD